MIKEHLANHRQANPPETSEPVNLGRFVGAKTNGSLAEFGMRDAVKALLSENKHGLRTGEIADQLLTRGFQYEATTNLKSRLSNELARMAKIGHIVRHKRRGKIYFSGKPAGG